MTKQVPKKTSIDLIYDILGIAALVDDMRVVIVSTVVTPSWTRAGLAFCESGETVVVSAYDRSIQLRPFPWLDTVTLETVMFEYYLLRLGHSQRWARQTML